MISFPSIEWLQELVRLMHENEVAFKRVGYADVTWAMEVQPSSSVHIPYFYRFVFEEYSCVALEEFEPGTAAEVDFVLQATYDTWREMIRNIQANNGPDLEHSLNRLTLMDDPMYIVASDFLSRDLFARYGQTFQLFFNGAIHVPTEFAA